MKRYIDYRELNSETIGDSYALPRGEEKLYALGGNSHFTVLAMRSGYHQVMLEETHKKRTAFTVGPLGFYEFNRLPFGPFSQQSSYISTAQGRDPRDLHLNICFIYLDILIIFADTFKEHFHRLEIILIRLR